MGHKNVTVTARYYTFVSTNEKNKAVDKINNILSGKKVVAKKRLKSVKINKKPRSALQQP